jgi:cysteine dioxygenase
MEYMGATPLPAEALQDDGWWRDSCSTRNLIYRDELFEVMTICYRRQLSDAARMGGGSRGPGQAESDESALALRGVFL